MFRVSVQFNTPLLLLIPTYKKVNGVVVKTYPNNEQGILIYASFKSFGGTEKVVDGLLSIDDTVEVTTWFKPEIKSDCIVALANSGARYEILGEPENIEMRNQYYKFKVRRIKGGV